MKRIIAIILATVTLFTSLVSLTGCSQKSEETLEIGQWLGMINNAFGMESYTKEEPYIETVSANDEYFSTVQIAAEWSVIQNNDSLNPREKLSWKKALVTLVNAGSFLDEDASEKEKIEYAIKNFDENIRYYWMNRTIDVESASKLLVTAQEKWANKTYDTPVQEVKYTENVIDFSENNMNVIDFNPSEGLIAIETNDDTEKIKKDDVFVMPASDKSIEKLAYKAEEIIEKDGITYIKANDDLEIDDFVDELYVEETYELDLTKAEIYDGNGDLVQSGATATPQSYYQNNDVKISNLASYSDDSTVLTPLAQNNTFSFKIDSCKVEVSIKKDGLSAKIDVPMSEKIKGYYETEVSNFKVTNKIDYSWLTLHSAEVKVDYSTKSSAKIKKEFVDKEVTYAPKWSNGNGKFLTNLKNSVWKDKDTGVGAKTIKIGSIKVASAGLVSFTVDVNAKLKVDGSIEVSYSETGCKGIEYKNGNCRVINTSNKNNDIKIKCKAEATVSVCPTVKAFGQSMIGLKAEAGLGAEASVILRLADSENHLLEVITAADIPPEVYEETNPVALTADAEEIKKLAESQGGIFVYESSTVNLHLDTCIDVDVYFILKVGVDEKTLAGKLLKKAKVKIEWEICNSKNAKLLKLHIDNFDFAKAFSNITSLTYADQCTLKYVPFDGVEEKDDEKIDESITNSSVTVGEVLIISTINVVLEPEKSTSISVTQIPKGYELKDLVYKSKNTDIATIDKNGVIAAKAEGTTTVIVSTSDGKYSCACTVTVIDEKINNFTPLSFDDYRRCGNGYKCEYS